MSSKSRKREQRKDEDYTTITLPRREYEHLVKFKRDLEQRPDYSWVAGLGLGAFIGFMIGLAASSAKRSVLTCGNCGTSFHITRSELRVRCPGCGLEYVAGKAGPGTQAP